VGERGRVEEEEGVEYVEIAWGLLNMGLE